MARHKHLPIYTAALSMAVYFEKLVAGFSLRYRYTLGTELYEGIRVVPWQVLQANDTTSASKELPNCWFFGTE